MLWYVTTRTGTNFDSALQAFPKNENQLLKNT